MENRSSRFGPVVAMFVLLAAVVGGIVAFAIRRHPAPAPGQAKQHPTTQPSTRAIASTYPGTTQPASGEPVVARNYLDVVRAAYPSFPTTQPLGFPLDLSQAAHLEIKDPVYVGSPPRRDLWITRADARPTDQVLKDAIDPEQDAQIHVTRERVAYVHWMPSDTGPWPPYLICPTSDGGYEVVTQSGRHPLPRNDYHWNHAFSWNDKVVVPCATGVSVLTLQPTVSESYHELAPSRSDSAQPLAEPQALLDWQGLLAWIPWEGTKADGRGAARYLDGKWTDLGPDAGWPEKILHLVPLNDGNVLVLSINDKRAVQLGLMVLEHVEVDQNKIAALVADLADPDEQKRDAAYKQLTRYGSGIWPILEKMIDEQQPEAQARLRLLLKEKVEPTLGGMKLVGTRAMRLVARLSDGGTVFYAESGVIIPSTDPDAEPNVVAPAWISIRPGEPIELLPPALVADLNPRTAKLWVSGSEWVVSSDARGPRRFVGNGFTDLVRRSEARAGFINFLGIDRRGRWIFAKALHPTTSPSMGPSTLPATVASATEADQETLIIDPTLPDPTPRLPVWVYSNAKVVGWDTNNWPVAKDISAYALHEDGWRLLGENEKILTKVEAPSTEPASAATEPTPSPATQSTSQPAAEPPILVDSSENRYFGGLTDLRVVTPTGKQIDWPLPPAANGEGPVALVQTPDHKLFLFNQPGRVLRLKPTLDASEPFQLEATFTHRIPTVRDPTRIWVDPAGRIIIAWEAQLAILFPTGYIPPAIAEKMLSTGDEDE